MKQLPEGLSVAVDGTTSYVHVVGRGTFKLGPQLREFCAKVQEQGVIRFVFDLRSCLGMDSTFMGVLAGLALKLRKVDGEVIMINLTPRTRGLISTLGLEKLLTIYMAETTPSELKAVFEDGSALQAIANVPAAKADMAHTMLEAHEALSALAPENEPKFKDLLTFLRQDVANYSANR